MNVCIKNLMDKLARTLLFIKQNYGSVLFIAYLKNPENAMKSPNDKLDLPNRPRRPAGSIREIRQRKSGNSDQSFLDRLMYALLNGLMYGVGGLLIDLAIVVIRSWQWRYFLAFHPFYADTWGINGVHRW